MTASTSRFRAGCAVTLMGLVLASTACKTEKEPKEAEDSSSPDALAEDGTDATTAEADAEIITGSLISATATSGSLTLASTADLGGGGLGTAAVGDGAKALYFPRNCLAVKSDEPARTVTYTFSNCAGPNGIFRIRGTIVTTYEVLPGKLVLNLVANALEVNKATVDWSARAEITATGPAREMRWKAQLTGTTARGKPFSRTNEKLVSWRFGERCFGVSGVSEGEVRGRYLRVEIADFRRCQGSCPEAGGRITITNADGKVKVEILYDGSNRATLTSPRGSTTFGLACTA